MIKINVKKRADAYESFTFSGHAGYAEEGCDIVCAAVSALVITTVNSIEKFTADQLEAREEDGYVFFRFIQPYSRESRLLMDSLVLGLTQIHQSYGNKYLKMIVEEV